MKTPHFSEILVLFLSVVYLTSAQLPDFGSIDRKKVISNATSVFSDICNVNEIKLDRQKMDEHIENCVKPHIEQIVGLGTDGSAGPMLMQIMAAVQTQPIKLTKDQRDWIKSRIIAPVCKIFPCVNPLKNPLMQPCLSADNSLGVKKGFTFTDMYLDAMCKDDGEILIALAESVNRECVLEFYKKLESCVKNEANFFKDDGSLNKTVAETCGILGKMNTCLSGSIKVCGPKATELYQAGFGTIEKWITTSCLDETNGSQSRPVWSFLAIILYVLLGEKIRGYLF